MAIPESQFETWTRIGAGPQTAKFNNAPLLPGVRNVFRSLAPYLGVPDDPVVPVIQQTFSRSSTKCAIFTPCFVFWIKFG